MVQVGQAQEVETHLYTADSVLMSIIKGGQFYTADEDRVSFTIKGNMVFRGDSELRKDIIHLFETHGLFARQRGFVYGNSTEEVQFTFRKGSFYIGKSAGTSLDELLRVQEASVGRYVLISALDDEPLAYLNNRNSTEQAIIFSALLVMHKYALADSLIERRKVANQNSLPHGTLGVIRSVWNPGPDTEWVWDGEVLRLRYANHLGLEWEFDGEVLRPKWHSNIYKEYVWDGEVLKPLWRSSSAEEWIFDGTKLKPMWLSDMKLEMELEGNTIKPSWNIESYNEWYYEGDVPLPLLFAVALGIVYR